MADYTYNELMKMQNDAIKRAEDMQKRARESAGLTKNISSETKQKEHIPDKATPDEPKRIYMPADYIEKLKGFASSSSAEKHEQKEEGKKTHKDDTKKEASQDFSDNLKKIRDDINTDADKALILSLILLLSEEGADEILIMALLYILT